MADAGYVLLSPNLPSSPLQLIGSGAEFTSTPQGIKIDFSQEFYLVYAQPFSYQDYDRLSVELQSTQEIGITVIADISTRGAYTFETQRYFKPPAYKKLTISLRHKNFKSVGDWGIKFSALDNSHATASIIINEITLTRSTVWQNISQLWLDFWRVAPYAPYTVNLLPTPLIWGLSAQIFFLPILVLLAAWLGLKKKKTKLTFGILLVSWLIIDLRMSYELFKYAQFDYQSWVAPKSLEQKLRSYGNFYAFIHWIERRLPGEAVKIAFYHEANPHLLKIMQYFLYPVVIDNQSGQPDGIIVYYDEEVHYDEQSGLMKNQEVLAMPGGEYIEFDGQSFIYLPKL